MKYVANSGRSTLYYNKMWQTSDVSADWEQGKHIYVGEDRIATKYSSADNPNTQAEARRTYYYHTDHLGSAQVVTNHKGDIHERLEYTPYGELWINYQSDLAPEDATPFRFTGKVLDAETGLYYFGARYLEPKTSRWMSVDPAVSDYLPSAPVNDEAKKRNGNLPGQGGVFNYVNLHVYHYAGNNPVKYQDPDGESPNDSTLGLSFDTIEDFGDFWGPMIGNISAFFSNRSAQDNMTAKGQYYLQEFDKNTVAALNTTSGVSSKATMFFLAIGQPEAAAVTSGINLAAEGILIAHDWVGAYKNNDEAGMNKAINNGTFLVAGLILGNATKIGVDKALSITAGGKTVNYLLNGNSWETTKENIIKEFGNLSGNIVQEILKASKQVYFEE